MGQVLSYLWRCFRPNVEDKSRKALLDDNPSQYLDHQQQSVESHCITIPDSHSVSGSNLGNVPNSSSNHFGPEVSYTNLADSPQQPLQSYCITISEIHSIQGSNSDNVPKSLADLASAVADLSSVVQKNDKKQQEKEPPAVERYADVSMKLVSENNRRKGKKVETKVSKLSEQIVKRIGPYTSIQKLLLVGEGDFSFSTCLAKAFGSALSMVATSLNSEDFLVKNYSNFPTNTKELKTRGCRVIHDVDATKLFKHPILGSLKFDRIIFNFPHVGKFGRNDADMRANKKLVREFIKNAKKMMNEDGEIHITHKSNGYFLEWDIPKIGSDHGLHLIQEVKFKIKKYPGYHTKYGFGGDQDFDCNPSKTCKFGLHPK